MRQNFTGLNSMINCELQINLSVIQYCNASTIGSRFCVIREFLISETYITKTYTR